VPDAGAGDGVDGGEQGAESCGLQGRQLLPEACARREIRATGCQQLRQAPLDYFPGHAFCRGSQHLRDQSA